MNFAAIIAFLTGNIKPIFYSIIAIVVAALLWQGYNIIRTNAQDEILIKQYKQNEVVIQQALKDKDAMIALEKNLNDLANQAVVDRDAELTKLVSDYDTIVNSKLGQDINSPAALSLKELIKELQAKEKTGK